METQLQHVSDTALMVAASRALETTRPDRLSADPFAAALAGERGRAIIAEMQSPYWMSFGMGLRTKFIDEFLLYEIGTRNIDCVVNLGAGLDTRPWRLNLNPTLHWIEADFNHILDYKHGVLRNETPRCRLDRLAADLNDPEGRLKIWQAISGQRALLLTEGLLMYLPAETVRALAKEARERAIESWILDFNSKNLLRAAHGDVADKINNLRASTHMEAEGVRDAVTANGWVQADEKRFVRDGNRYAVARMMRDGIVLPADGPRIGEDDPGGIGLFHKG